MAFTRLEDIDVIAEIETTGPFDGLAPVEFRTLKEVYETVAAESGMSEQNVRKTIRTLVSKYFDSQDDLYALYKELLEMAKTPAADRAALQARKVSSLKTAVPIMDAELEDTPSPSVGGGPVLSRIEEEREYAVALASLGSAFPMQQLMEAAAQQGQLAGTAEAACFLQARRETTNRILTAAMQADLDALKGV